MAATTKSLYEDLYVNDTVNIGSDVEITILELAKSIVQITKSKSKIVHLPPLKEGDMLRRVPDITKMKALLGKDILPMQEGIKMVIKSGWIKQSAPASSFGTI